MRWPWQKRPAESVEPTAREIRDLWLAAMEANGARPGTLKGYRLITNRFLDRWPDVKFSEFDGDHITGIIEEQNPASRMAWRGPFSSWFAWGARTRRLERDPMRHVPFYKQPQPPHIDLFTEDEVKILRALPFPDGVLVDLLLSSGLRKAEARHFQVRRIDFENAELHIVEGAKGGSIGVVPVEHRIIHRLAEYVTLEGLNDTDYLWYCHPGGRKERVHDRPIQDGSMHMWWVRCIETAGIPYRKLHTTRHHFATDWRRRGLGMDDVSYLLRHADSRTTSRVYVHLKAVDLRKKMEALNAS
jgi:integrase